jgi:hypothetical protein
MSILKPASLPVDFENDHYEQNYHCEGGQILSSEDHSHNIRLRQLLLPAIFAILVIGGLLAWTYVHRHALSDQGIENLILERAINARTAADEHCQWIYSLMNIRRFNHIYLAISSCSLPRNCWWFCRLSRYNPCCLLL